MKSKDKHAAEMQRRFVDGYDGKIEFDIKAIPEGPGFVLTGKMRTDGLVYTSAMTVSDLVGHQWVKEEEIDFRDIYEIFAYRLANSILRGLGVREEES